MNSILLLSLLLPGMARVAAAPLLAQGNPCSASPATLCLNASRFQVQVQWRNYNDGSTGSGKSLPLTGDSGCFWFFNSANIELVIKVLDGRAVNGYFWFFDPGNAELFIKILDGRAINGHFWVMYGALSDLEYRIDILDQFTQTARSYSNTARTLASRADVQAFSGSAPGVTGAIYATDSLVGNLRFAPGRTCTQGSPVGEACRDPNEAQFFHTLIRNLAVMETEVTQAMWAALRSAQPSLPEDPSYFSAAAMRGPVERVTWYEAVLFANLLSRQQERPQVYFADAALTLPIDAENYQSSSVFADWNAEGFRLPTEGEWEYFTRAGSRGPFFFN